MKAVNMDQCRRQFRFKPMRSQLVRAFGASMLGMTAMHAHAQLAPAADENTVQTIEVTARKVKEKLQEVPLAITALTAETLKNAGAANLADISRLTPGLSVADEGVESGYSPPVIRGMANIAGLADPNVAVFLDGIYLTNSATVNMGLIGLDRVEVIKGPVSATYGRNAYAGAINYVTKQPSAKFGGDASLTYGSDGQKIATASMTGTLVPGLLFGRAALVSDRFDGTYKDQVNGLRAGGHNKKDALFSLLFTPSENWELGATYYHGDDAFDDPAQTYTANNCGPKSTSPVTLGSYTRYCGEIDYSQQPVEVSPSGNSGSVGNQRKVDSLILKSTYATPLGDFTALFGDNSSVARRYSSYTGHRDGLVALLVPGPGTVTLPEIFGADSNNDDHSLELRFSSKQDVPFRWSLGLYGYKAKYTTTTIIAIDGSGLPAGQTIGPPTATGVGAANFVTTDGQPSTSNISLAHTTDKILSEFVGLDYDLNAKLTASAEYRHTHQEKAQDIVRSNSFANLDHPLGYFAPAAWSFNNYRAALRYKLTTDAMLYGTSANGTKAGGFNLRATLPSEVAYAPETTRSLEIGAKTNWLQNRLQINVAAFHVKSKDLQLAGASDDPKTPALVTKNFGGLTNKGYEIEIVAVPARGVQFNLGYAYADPKFDSGTYEYSNAAVCATIPSCAGRITQVTTPQGTLRKVVDLGGMQVMRVSKQQLSAGVELKYQLVDNYNWFGRLDLRYESKQYQTDQTLLGLSWLPEKTTMNLRTGIIKGDLTYTFYVNNLTDNRVPARTDNMIRLTDFNGQMVSMLTPQRTFGLTASYKF